ncbi:hypothetical protein [Streptomyces sp. RTd22]|uniref:hypothetical protein n=1 Tax=Streptomyces sp. RTd22 TaxID=1841249 RepID=UPI00131D640C|nr:hypothetical protein [Streptomyces sp. RTd22]
MTPAAPAGPSVNAATTGRAMSSKLTGHCAGVTGSIARIAATYRSGSQRSQTGGAGTLWSVSRASATTLLGAWERTG